MNSKYSSFASFLDILFNCVLIFAVLFVMSMLIQVDDASKNNKQGDIVAKAEYLITIEWDNESENDVDIWLKLPDQTVLFFNNKDSRNGIFLERDDLGAVNDIRITEDGELKTIKINKEVVTFRAIIPGDYTVNVHGYALNKDPLRRNEKVKVSVIRINPLSIVLEKDIVIEHGQEVTAWNFTMDQHGKILNVNTLPVKMVYKR